jgi:TolA-binding protein
MSKNRQGNLINWVTLTMAVCLSGCMVSRYNLPDPGSRNSRISKEQQEKANTEAQRLELEEQSKQALGRVDALEFQNKLLQKELSILRQSHEAEKKQYEEKVKIYEETLAGLEAQNVTLTAQLTQLREKKATKEKEIADKVAQKSSSKTDAFIEAEKLFQAKDWKGSIAQYETYREKNPKGKAYAEATYKIGVCFQELGLKAESKAFYNEAVEKFPKSEFAKKSQIRLKSLR